MKITYTGKVETFYPVQTRKLEARSVKLGKLLDGKGEKQAHVILTQHKNTFHAEITLNYLHHALVGAAKDPDQFTAIGAAFDKIEKQILKLRAKRRDTKKGEKQPWPASAPAAPPVKRIAADKSAGSRNGTRRIFRVKSTGDLKPMSVEEAILEIDKDGPYLVYRDSSTNRLAVLLRRQDGHFDLVES